MKLPHDSKGVRYHAGHQAGLIKNDIVQLLSRESDGTLSDNDIKRFRLLLSMAHV